MGAIGYATQSGLYFDALERMDASLLALILYVYPALVLIGAVALGRERASVRRVAALLIALAGTALVLAGAASGSLDALGTAMGFGAALAYTVYILTGDRVGAAVPPLALAAFVCLRATSTFAGPLFIPGRSACWMCYRMRALACEQDFDLGMTYEEHLDRKRQPGKTGNTDQHEHQTGSKVLRTLHPQHAVSSTRPAQVSRPECAQSL